MKKKRNPGTIVLLIVTLSLIISSGCKKEGDPGIIHDAGGNTYKSIIIGTQTWMAENLKATKYNDGSAIPNIRDSVKWASSYSPAYCWYRNDSTSNNSYGALYNLFAVNSKKLCPTGWHVPTDTEWATLFDFLGGEPVAANKLKEPGTTHWRSSYNEVTNESGFTALPGGLRGLDGSFLSRTWYGYWWIAPYGAPDTGYTVCMSYEGGQIYPENFYERIACSVRCIKNQ